MQRRRPDESDDRSDEQEGARAGDESNGDNLEEPTGMQIFDNYLFQRLVAPILYGPSQPTEQQVASEPLPTPVALREVEGDIALVPSPERRTSLFHWTFTDRTFAVFLAIVVIVLYIFIYYSFRTLSSLIVLFRSHTRQL